MRKMQIKLTFVEPVLGTGNSNPEIHSEFIASKAPDAKSREEEVAALGADVVEEKTTTIFARDDQGRPIIWNYQIKGFFKDTCSALRSVPGSESKKIKAFKKIIDGNIFVEERKIPLQGFGRIGECQRPLRASTAQGERIALAHSETVPAETYIVFTITCTEHDKYDLMAAVKEWLDYGKRRGLLQWRNSGKGTFVWNEVA